MSRVIQWESSENIARKSEWMLRSVFLFRLRSSGAAHVRVVSNEGVQVGEDSDGDDGDTVDNAPLITWQKIVNVWFESYLILKKEHDDKGKTIVQCFVIQGNLFQAFSSCRHASAEAGERQALLLCSHAIVNNPELGMGYYGYWLSCLVKCDL